MPDVGTAANARDAASGTTAPAGPADADGAEDCDGVQAVSEWAAWPMPNPVSSGLAHPQAYTDHGDGTVTDEVTGLVWQQDLGARDAMAWDAAQLYCADLVLAGHCDFRVPSRIELISLLDLEQPFAVVDAVFPGTIGSFFWTSSLVTSPTQGQGRTPAWRVEFGTGYVISHSEGDPYVRCVRNRRAGTAPPERYEVTDDIVLDIQTGLTWQRVPDAASFTWSDAAAHCASLALAGSSWRLPSAKELQTIVDETTAYPAIDEAAFPGLYDEWFWSSSTVSAGSNEQKWAVWFNSGTSGAQQPEYEQRVRCVR
jgi:hypothetical protein